MSGELKLLPCPACGKTGKLFYGIDWYAIACSGFRCRLQGPVAEEKDGAAIAWNSLPRALEWTTDPPTEPGHYWCRYTGSDKTTWSPAYIPAVGDLHTYNMNEHEQIEWAGPIPMPKEPTS